MGLGACCGISPEHSNTLLTVLVESSDISRNNDLEVNRLKSASCEMCGLTAAAMEGTAARKSADSYLNFAPPEASKWCLFVTDFVRSIRDPRRAR